MAEQQNRPAATPSVLIDNDRTLVTEWRFAPGAETGWHRHEMDYVVVPSLDGKLLIVTEGGVETTADLKANEPYFRTIGVEHNVINANDFEFAFIEVEFR